MSVWDDYKKIQTINVGSISKIYKAISKITRKKFAIKEIDKSKLKNINIIIEKYERIKLLNSKNIMKIETTSTKEYYYIIMELCPYSLEEYILENPISIDDIKEIFIQINNGLKELYDNQIEHSNLKLSNILISFEQFNKFLIKLSGFGYKEETLFSKANDNFLLLTIAPEILENGNFSLKNDLWSLGIILYYLMFKEYPFNGINEYQLIEQIKKGKKLKKSKNEEFNDLIEKLLVKDINKRISWENYFKHPFFNSNNSFPNFDFNCEIHSKIIGAYCINCKCNICQLCLEQHPLNKHKIISFSKIGFSKNEKYQIDILLQNIDKNLNKLIKITNEIKTFYQQLKNINENNEIYEKDIQNNFKNYYIKCLNIINEKIKIEGNFLEYNILKGFPLINKNKKLELKQINLIKAHESWVRDVEIFPSGKIISVSSDLSIKIYDNNFKVLQIIKNAHNKDVVYVDIKDENNFVTSSCDGSIYTWIKKDNKFKINKKIINAHEKPIWKVIYSSNGNLISCSDDKLIKIWDNSNYENEYRCILKLEHKNNIGSILLLEDKNLLISSGLDGTKFWNNNNYSLIKSIENANSCSRNNLITLDNDRLFVGGGWEESKMKIISISQKKIIKEVENNFTCFAVCVLSDKEIFITGGESNDINVFRNDNYNLIFTFKNAHYDNIYGIVQLKNGNVVSFSGDNHISVWAI